MLSRVAKVEWEKGKAIEKDKGVITKNDTWNHVKHEKNNILNCSAWFHAPTIAYNYFSWVMWLKIDPGF